MSHIKEMEDEKDIELAQQWYDTHDRHVFEFKKKIIEFLAKAKANEEVPLRCETPLV